MSKAVVFDDGSNFSVSPPWAQSSTEKTPEEENKKVKMKKRKSSMKPSNWGKDLGGEDDGIEDKPKRTVSFFQEVTVRTLPVDEADAAKETRRGEWEPAPDHDELWDGDQKVFWDKEKTIEEVRRIVVIRGMRMALLYNLGFAFFSMVANFKKRHAKISSPLAKEKREKNGVDDDAGTKASSSSAGEKGDDEEEEDYVIEFNGPEDEEMAIRKEIRELFSDSVKGLDFPELMQDRDAFEKLYLTTVLRGTGEENRQKFPDAGLKKIQVLVDEVMYEKEICEMLEVVFTPPTESEAEQKSHETAVRAAEAETQRRSERRRSVEQSTVTNAAALHTEEDAGAKATRRGSTERRSSNIGAVVVVVDEVDATGSGAVAVQQRRASIERRTSLERRASIERRTSLERRTSIEQQKAPSQSSTIVTNDGPTDEEIAAYAVASMRRSSIRRSSVSPPLPSPSLSEPQKVTDSEESPIFGSSVVNNNRSTIRPITTTTEPERPSPLVLSPPVTNSTRGASIEHQHGIRLIVALLVATLVSVFRSSSHAMLAPRTFRVSPPQSMHLKPLRLAIPLVIVFAVTMWLQLYSAPHLHYPSSSLHYVAVV